MRKRSAGEKNGLDKYRKNTTKYNQPACTDVPTEMEKSKTYDLVNATNMQKKESICTTVPKVCCSSCFNERNDGRADHLRGFCGDAQSFAAAKAFWPKAVRAFAAQSVTNVFTENSKALHPPSYVGHTM